MRYLCLFLALLFLSCSQQQDYPIQRHSDYEPPIPAKPALQLWSGIKPGLYAAVALTDERYAVYKRPHLNEQQWSGSGWRGERINLQLLVWSKNDIHQIHCRFSDLVSSHNRIDKDCLHSYFVRSTIAWNEMYYKPGQKGDNSIDLVPDILDPEERIDLAAKSCRPVWISIDIPQDAEPGSYETVIKILSTEHPPIPITCKLNVLPHTLPSPKKWSIHLDLWQNPFAVAEFHKVKLWSDAHFAIMHDLFTRLGDAGQKCITTSIIHHPWNAQAFSPFESMIKWTKNAVGEWEYDFSIFDKYIQFMMDCGISEQINCYSMIPWNNTFQYFDESSGMFKSIIAEPGEAAYEQHWRPFLAAFQQHLREKTWLHKTYIAMDERDAETMEKLCTFIHKTAPGLKIALAVNYLTDENPGIDDLSVGIQFSPEQHILDARNKAGQHTTFYVCTGPIRPNTFTKSPPHEAVWLGWHAFTNNFNGILRWAYNWWPENPLTDSRYIKWPSGDSFLVYPNYSSIRFECLRDGIEDYEKLKILKKKLTATQRGKRQWQKMEKLLADINYENAQNPKKSLHILTKARENLIKLSE